jgi:hypothetical protein
MSLKVTDEKLQRFGEWLCKQLKDWPAEDCEKPIQAFEIAAREELGELKFDFLPSGCSYGCPECGYSGYARYQLVDGFETDKSYIISTSWFPKRLHEAKIMAARQAIAVFNAKDVQTYFNRDMWEYLYEISHGYEDDE